ncbi:MAG: hypothetical protein VYA49_02425 [Planctomycetota bacterium]|nr:hypothetical protein [Planctomycetota bacterium]
MKFADWFFVFMLFVFAVLLILTGVLSFLLGSPSFLAAFGIFAGFGLCIGVFVGCCLSGRIKNTIGGRMPKGEQQTPL